MKTLLRLISAAALALGISTAQPVQQISNANVTGNLTFGTVAGGKITGAVGAVSIAASGTNQNITLTPSGTGSLDLVSTQATAVAMTGYYNTSTLGLVLQRIAGNVILDARTAGDGILLRTNGTTTALTLASDQGATFAAGLQAKGVYSANAASTVGVGVVGGVADFTSWGANAATNGTFQWRSQRSDGSSTVTAMTLSGAGALTTAAGITATTGNMLATAGSIYAGAGNYIGMNGRALFSSSGDGIVQISMNDGTTGSALDISTAGTFKFRNFANSADAAITALSLALSGGSAVVDIRTATAALDFGNILAAASADLTITVTGAAVGDNVLPGLPADPDASLAFDWIVTAANTVTVRAHNVGSIAVDQASKTFRATIIGF